MKGIRKIYGPYQHKVNKRNYVVIHYVDGTKKSTAYSRFLIEEKLGRELIGDETADHIDGNFTNDSIDNLQILSLSDNIRKSHKGIVICDLECFWCKEKFTRDARNLRRSKKLDRNSFCSKSCAGKYGKVIQMA